MSVNSFDELRAHISHDVSVVWYGMRDDPHNVAIECNDCGEVLLDYDAPEAEDEGEVLAVIPKGYHPIPPGGPVKPEEAKALGMDPTIDYCYACIDAYRNGIEPGGSACDERAHRERE